MQSCVLRIHDGQFPIGIGSGGFIADSVSLAGIGWLALVTCLMAAPLFVIVSLRLRARVPDAATD